jgi:ACS family glucarate transporter-like MFS transporter
VNISPPPSNTAIPRPTWVRYRVLGMLFLLGIVTYLDRMAIGGAGPFIRRDLDLTPLQLGAIFGAFQLAYGIFEIPSGWMGDRFGPRRMLVRIVIWWSAFTALTGRMNGFVSMWITRFLFGAGEAGAYPNASCVVSRWFPFVERARAHGLIWMSSRLGGAFAPLLVAPMLDPDKASTVFSVSTYVGWRVVFYMFGGLGIVWAAGWYFWYRDYPDQKVGVNAAEIELIRKGGVAPSHHQKTPWGLLFHSKNMWAIVLAYFVYGYGVQFFFFWLPTYVKEVRGLKDWAPYAALPFLLGAGACALGGWFSDALVRRFGLRWGRRAAGLIGLGSSCVWVLLSFATDRPEWAVIALACAFAATDFTLPTFWAVCLDIGKHHAGTVTGTMNTAAQIGGAIAAPLIGYLAGKSHWNLVIGSMGVALAAAAALFFLIDASEPLVPEEERGGVHTASA